MPVEPLFDPETGKLRDRDALKSISFNGQDMKIPGTPNAAPKLVKPPGVRAKPSPGDTTR